MVKVRKERDSVHSALGRMYLELEREYKARVFKNGEKPMANFISKANRLIKPKTAFQTEYDVPDGFDDAKTEGKSPWVKFEGEQREKTRKCVQAMYSIKRQQDKEGCASLRSNVSRFGVDKEWLPGQEKIGLNNAHWQPSGIRKPHPCFRSNAPRLSPERQALKGDYFDKNAPPGSIEFELGKKEEAKMTWSKSGEPQRPPVRKLTDKFYNLNALEKEFWDTQAGGAVMNSHSEKLPGPVSATPAPGTYTSKFIAVGLEPD